MLNKALNQANTITNHKNVKNQKVEEIINVLN